MYDKNGSSVFVAKTPDPLESKWVLRLFGDGATLTTMEKSLKRPAGHWRWLRVISHPVVLRTIQVIGALAAIASIVHHWN